MCPVIDLSLNMSNTTILYAASLCAAVSLALVLKWQRSGSRPPHPPGPRAYPLIGSILAVPHNVPIWKGFMSIARELSRCLTLAGGHPTETATVPRHELVVPEAIFNRLRYSEQLRGHLQSSGETI